MMMKVLFFILSKPHGCYLWLWSDYLETSVNDRQDYRADTEQFILVDSKWC